ncbi:Protein of unknown function [Gryllus bimaculatus]|nr:Protein of unknown function [Gryllus bimaculatus]
MPARLRFASRSEPRRSSSRINMTETSVGVVRARVLQAAACHFAATRPGPKRVRWKGSSLRPRHRCAAGEDARLGNWRIRLVILRVNGGRCSRRRRSWSLPATRPATQRGRREKASFLTAPPTECAEGKTPAFGRLSVVATVVRIARREK